MTEMMQIRAHYRYDGADAAARVPVASRKGLDRLRSPWTAIALFLLLVAFVLRSSQFGNPLIQVDENFYLLVGDRMLHGALPYVDIWDRKPIGLFLIYAAVRLFGGTGIVEYQVAATLFAAGTAFVIARIASHVAPKPAAVAAGILYLLMLALCGGMGGQAPVFYNLFVAGAALVTLRAILLDAPSPAAVLRAGALCMALCGIAMQIKYTALFEGVFFGLVLIGLAWRASHAPVKVMASAALWVGIALAPTALALAYYAWRGHAGEFIYANFLSIGARSTEDGGELLKRIAHSWNAISLPIFCMVLSAILEPWRAMRQGGRSFGFVMAWFGAALAGYLVFGTYFDHYALPLLVPIAIGCAPLFGVGRRHIGLIAAGTMLLIGTVAYAGLVHANHRKRGGAERMAAMVAAIKPRLDGCMFVFDGDPMLYYLTQSCIPTRYAFASHLNFKREVGAIGTDPLVEIRRILSTRPHLIVDTVDGDARDKNPAAEAIAHEAFRRDYHVAATVPGYQGTMLVYERNRR